MPLTSEQIQILKDNASLILAPGAPRAVGGFQAIRPVSEAGRFDFSRTTTKTVDGVTVPINTPAFDSEGALVLEPASTNLLTYSQEFDNAVWVKNGTTCLPNQAIAPDGTLTADLIYPSIGADKRFSRPLSVLIGTTYTHSIIAKPAGKRYIRIYNVLFSGAIWADFDLQTGIIAATSGGITANITPQQNGYYRCEVAGTATATGSQFYVNILDSPTNNSISTQTGIDGVYFWGAQLEAGTYASSYIPTAGSTATRTVDAPDLKNQNFSGAFSLFFNLTTFKNLVGLFDFYNAAGSRIFYLANDSTGKTTINSLAGGPSQTPFGAAKINGGDFKMIIRVNGDGTLNLFQDGAKHPATISTTLTDFKRMIRTGSFGYEIGIKLHEFALFPAALDDATAIALTK